MDGPAPSAGPSMRLPVFDALRARSRAAAHTSALR